MAKIHVDGKQYEVSGADNLLQACLSLGLDIPYFCWHPALGSVGACRQCAVKQYRDENDKTGRIVMSCMTQAQDDMYIAIEDVEAVEFREAIIEFLMTNHPHDCPVCEEGGHCHLQDMTVMTRHHSRSYRFDKRTHLNQDLGPFIGHEMNRCISCYRCVRYYRDYAGGTDLGVYGAASNVYFGRPQPGVLENEFSGNLTEVCPTGVFTDKAHSEHYTRKWDMQFAPGICTGCSVGCNVSPGERYGEVRRIENRYHGALNGYFLCDRGRFGFGHSNRKDRPRLPVLKIEGRHKIVAGEVGLEQLRAITSGAKRMLGIGSPRASLEANFALRERVGAARFNSGVSRHELELTQLAAKILRGPVGASTLRSMEDADCVLILGEDLTQTAPRIALAVRQAARGKMVTEGAKKNIPEWQVIALADLVQQARNPIYVSTAQPSRLDDVATRTFNASAERIAQLGFAIAHRLDGAAPVAVGLDQTQAALADEIAAALATATRPLIVSGTGSGCAEVMQAAANIAWALKKKDRMVGLALALPEANSMGSALFDASPLELALEAATQGEVDVLVVLENDLYRRAPKAVVDAALAKCRLIVIDHMATDTGERADLLLPAGNAYESDGTLVNYEGRAQRYFQVYDPTYYDRAVAIQESWRWCDEMSAAPAWQGLDDLIADCAKVLPQFSVITETAPNARFRMKGMKMARSPHRASGRTAQRANLSVHEPRQLQDADSALAFTMEGVNGAMGIDRPAELLPFAWAPGWNSPQAWNKFQAEVGGELKGGDAGEPVLVTDDQIQPQYFAPAAPSSGSGLRAVALHHIFGSEEQSGRADVLLKRAPQAYVALSVADIERLGIQLSARVEVDGTSVVLPVVVSSSLEAGSVGLPVGLRGVPYASPGSAISVEAA
ncbi:NADH-quinone oxidoreductase subunit NuoG [Panacagrimonas sp.]|uniref:NADH-quinone oxidoreductase subunit NuoG n=1 Tax=Panacagrimonas sp. TaxID=2480088 RepID=UPI003B517DB9